MKGIIIIAKIFSVIITITLHLFELNHDYNYIIMTTLKFVNNYIQLQLLITITLGRVEGCNFQNFLLNKSFNPFKPNENFHSYQ